MKKYIIASIAALVMIAAIIVLWKLYVSVKKELHDTQIELNIKTSETQIYKDKVGFLHAKVDEYSKHIKELKGSGDSIERAMYLNAKNAGIKDRQIQSLQYALFESRDSIAGYIEAFSILPSNDLDGILEGYTRKIKFNNGSLSADVLVPLSDLKPYILSYSYSTEVFMTDRWYRPKSKFFLWKWIGVSFQKKQNQFDFRVSDTNARIKIVRDVSVE